MTLHVRVLNSFTRPEHLVSPHILVTSGQWRIHTSDWGFQDDKGCFQAKSFSKYHIFEGFFGSGGLLNPTETHLDPPLGVHGVFLLFCTSRLVYSYFEFVAVFMFLVFSLNVEMIKQ